MGTAHRIRVVVVLGVAAAAHGAVAQGFRAEPPVAVIELAANGSGSGSGAIVLRNDTASSVAVGSITAEPGCDAAVQASPLAGFTLAAGATRAISIACAPAPPGMRRCEYRVRSPGNAVLLELEAVCAYAGSATLAPDPAAIEFGTVVVGGRASRTIALDNGGPAFAKLFVQTTDLAGTFVAAAPCNPDARECDAPILTVPPSSTTRVTIACTPRTAGPHSAQLHVVTSAGTRLTAPIALGCTGAPATTPVLSAKPGAVDVGTVELVGAIASTTVSLGNAGSGMLRLLDVQIVDGGTGAAADWSYAARAPCSPAIPPACVLAAGQTVDLDLALDPTAIAVRDAALLINYRDTADRSLAIPLRGVGRGATLDLVGGRTLDFGTLPLDVAGALTFQVANRGTRNLTGGSLTVMPAGAPFTVTPGPSFTVATGATTTFTATCRPTGAGLFTADVRLTSPDLGTPIPIDRRSQIAGGGDPDGSAGGAGGSAPGGIDIALRCAGDPATGLTATPPAIQLGEVRLPGPVITSVAVATVGGGSGAITASLETQVPGLTLRGAPATTPALLELAAAPDADGDLADRAIITPGSGPPLAVAITGTAVTAAFRVPPAVSLGTFCVDQPTTPQILQLTSAGTATITAMTPVLQSGDSPFDLELVAPPAYPAVLAPGGRALVAATPKRRAIAGIVMDDVIWTTDVADTPIERTKLTAGFVDNGGAIAPQALDFGATAIHLAARNAQQVTLQNCDVSALQLDPPQVPAPFSIDSPALPSLLRPGETITFGVGFRPTRTGPVSKTLVITSPQLRDVRLTVALTGEGVAGGVGDDGGDPTGDLDRTSFYACGGCIAGDASGPVALAIAALCVLARRRRRR
jgi:hypothetical protein